MTQKLSVGTSLRCWQRWVSGRFIHTFLAADPDAKIKGVGSALLRTLEDRTPGKTIYLHTDDACTYQFYERRGFQRVEEQEIVLEMPKGKVPLKCYIYSKKIEQKL